ncbi:hypothetical protein [Aquimarina algicola]|uniref:DUF4293 family protein n=1 Tax=Aquimarina algicola TaxID=2589995 RepID=A0A504IZW2_9FLAO|nr:hypothetical protein [Aquimarina algicola]TPN81682.1 hypothetical protein FHK87_24080 [Aquimarina algicola]
MNILQKSLLANSIFSSASGILLIIFNRYIADLFGVSSTTAFWVTGIVLLFFAITIIIEIVKQRRLAIIWIIIQDILWVLASIILVITNPFSITKPGNYMISIIAFIVLCMAILQARALSQIKNARTNTIH